MRAQPRAQSAVTGHLDEGPSNSICSSLVFILFELIEVHKEGNRDCNREDDRQEEKKTNVATCATVGNTLLECVLAAIADQIRKAKQSRAASEIRSRCGRKL